MNKFEGVPFHGTPPSSKSVGNTSTSNTFHAKLGNFAHHAGMAVGTMKAVHDGYKIARPLLQAAVAGARMLV